MTEAPKVGESQWKSKRDRGTGTGSVYDEKRRALRRKNDDGNVSTREA